MKCESFMSGLLRKTKEIFVILKNRLFAETGIHWYPSQFWQILSTKQSLVGSGLTLGRAASNVYMFLLS